MTRSRLQLAAAAALFVGWIAWLGYAVSQKDRAAVVSRAQLTAATHLLVADVAVDAEGLPTPTAKITEVLRGDGPKAGDAVEVLNLPTALPPGATAVPAGPYLLAVVGDGKTYKLAGVPVSPGYEAVTPPRPQVYAWTADTRAQLRGLGLIP